MQLSQRTAKFPSSPRITKKCGSIGPSSRIKCGFPYVHRYWEIDFYPCGKQFAISFVCPSAKNAIFDNYSLLIRHFVRFDEMHFLLRSRKYRIQCERISEDIPPLCRMCAHKHRTSTNNVCKRGDNCCSVTTTVLYYPPPINTWIFCANNKLSTIVGCVCSKQLPV